MWKKIYTAWLKSAVLAWNMQWHSLGDNSLGVYVGMLCGVCAGALIFSHCVSEWYKQRTAVLWGQACGKSVEMGTVMNWLLVFHNLHFYGFFVFCTCLPTHEITVSMSVSVCLSDPKSQCMLLLILTCEGANCVTWSCCVPSARSVYKWVIDCQHGVEW